MLDRGSDPERSPAQYQLDRTFDNPAGFSTCSGLFLPAGKALPRLPRRVALHHNPKFLLRVVLPVRLTSDAPDRLPRRY